jgi:sugar lactone lactonase YvrE
MAILTRTLLSATAAATIAGALALPASAAPFPEVIPLPDLWQAEGVASGPGSLVYAGSLATGAVYRADLRTGSGHVVVPPQPGRAAVGLKYAKGQLFVAGGPSGHAYVYDATTGAELADFALGTPGATFVNDVTVTPDAAWFTDSFSPVLYRVPLEHGEPVGQADTVPLGGDWVQVGGFNANGITATASGRQLLVVNSTVGSVYAVDPESGEATRVETEADLTAGDGILLQGLELAVVRNQLNEVAVLRLAPDLRSARLIDTLTDPDFDVPTTVAAFGGHLYAVNAKFGSPPADYEIVKVDGS